MMTASAQEKDDAAPEVSARVTKLRNPKLFYALVGLYLGLATLGFLPAVLVYLKRGKWFVNPITQPSAWGGEHTRGLKFHVIIAFLWMVACAVQFVLTPHLMFTKRLVEYRRLHRYVGYASVALVCIFALQGALLSLERGVAGKVVNNFIAILTGVMVMYHLIEAIKGIFRKAIDVHVENMSALLCWVCFPGIVRLWAIIPLQIFMFKGGDCDVLSTSGPLTVTMPLITAMIATLQYCALGPDHVRWKSFLPMLGFSLLDCFLGFIDGSFLQCSSNPLLEQAPGRPWVLSWQKFRVANEL